MIRPCGFSQIYSEPSGCRVTFGNVVVLESNNDFPILGLIGNPVEAVSVARVIQGHRQMIDRAHVLGIRRFNVVFERLFPWFRSELYWVAKKE